MIHVETSNAASERILKIGLATAAGALGAALVQSPIGPAGGALFGLVEEVVIMPLRGISAKIFNSDNPLASQSARILAAVLEFFGSFAIAWGVLEAAGMTMTLGKIAVLVCGTYISALILGTALGIFSVVIMCEN